MVKTRAKLAIFRQQAKKKPNRMEAIRLFIKEWH
jgi:hypothetical protein